MSSNNVYIQPSSVAVGETYGRLTVLAVSIVIDGARHAICRCAGGRDHAEPRLVVVQHRNLRAGTKSCGCLQRENAHKTHGLSGTPEHRAWHQAKQRCYNVRHPRYKDYGGRGITMCDEWRESFAAFYRDMGTRPTPQHSLDRYPDNDGPYCKDNCRWATPTEQSNNTRSCQNRKPSKPISPRDVGVKKHQYRFSSKLFLRRAAQKEGQTP